MNDRESVSPLVTPDDLEQDDNGSEETSSRSRSKRRTAKEIAQMFEELKLRYKSRKNQWQREREKMLKQMAAADERKRILCDLKLILEDLKIQLCREESKRRKAEEDHVRAMAEWMEEREKLMKIIDDLESHRNGNYNYDKHLADEIEVLKSQLGSRERNLFASQKLNADLEEQFQEERSHYKEEKRKLIEEYEGEKRNWVMTRQVMLDKIESLQLENNHLSSNTFLLHGSHVATPSEDRSLSLSSSVTDERSSPEKYTAVKTESPQAQEKIDFSDKGTFITFNHFQTTVDEALRKIDKINQEFNPNVYEGATYSAAANIDSMKTGGSRSPNKSPSQSIFMLPSSEKILSTDSIKFDGRAKILRIHESSHTSHGAKSSQERLSPKKSGHFKPTQNAHNLSIHEQATSTSRPTRESEVIGATLVPETVSPALSTSTASCSLPVCTESGTDSSPSNAGNIQESKDATKSTAVKAKYDLSQRKTFSKMEKSYNKIDEQEMKKQGTSTKKLPNLHQMLLFRSQNPNETADDRVTSNAKLPVVFPKSGATDIHLQQNEREIEFQFQPGSRNVRQVRRFSISPGPEEKSCSPSKNRRSPNVDDFVKVAANTVVKDNKVTLLQNRENQLISNKLEKVSGNDLLNQEISFPRIRPKPSVTIEKDAKGTLLRVVTDPRFQRQSSPSRHTDGQLAKERRRYSGGYRDLSPLVPLTNTSPVQLPSKTSPPASFDKYATGLAHLESKSSKNEGRESLGVRGKSWIKKHLSFLDSSPKVASSLEKYKLEQVKQKETKSKGKPRSSSMKRTEYRRKLVMSTTSDDSDDGKTRQRSKKPPDRSNDEERAYKGRSRAKKYIRSKTDSSFDMRNLLSHFQASQFNTKKPTVVKQFEKRLLENEIRTLEDSSTADTKTASKHDDGLRVMKVSGYEEDDGYRGEDEQDNQSKIKNDHDERVRNISLTTVRTPSITLPNERYSPPPTTKYNKSTIQLNVSKGFDDVTANTFDRYQEKKYLGVGELYTNSHLSPHRRYTSVQTTVLAKTQGQGMVKSRPEIFSTVKAKSFEHLDSNDMLLKDSTERKSVLRRPSAISVEDTQHRKRLSWSPNSLSTDGSTWRDKVISSTTLIRNSRNYDNDLAKESNAVISTTIIKLPDAENKSMDDNTPATIRGIQRRYMSEDMKRKAANLERVLRHGPTTPRARRYTRSETQPLRLFSSTDESDQTDVSESRGMTRSASMPSEEFTKELHHNIVPGLTSRFKKPILINRKPPSRWKKSG